MAIFTYKAKKGPEEIVEGKVRAENKEMAISQLLSEGVTPIKVETSQSSDVKAQFYRERRFERVRSYDVDIFTRQFASLIKSSITLISALHIISEQTENERFRRIISSIATEIENGEILSDALSKYPKLFSSIYINMIKSGEAGGTMEEALKTLVEFREKEDEIRSKIKSALAYPVFLVITGILTVFVLFTFFMPRLIDLFNQLGQTLPLPTRILISVTNFAKDTWAWIVIGSFVLALFLKRKGSSKGGRLAADWLKLHLPIIGKLIKKAEISRFARASAVLLKSGLSLFKAIEVAVPLVDSEIFRNELIGMNKKIISGSSLADSMKTVSYFSPMVLNMVAVGEESGHLEESLLEVASFYEKEAERSIKLITSLMEPVIVMIIGALVGFIVFAMLLPIFSIDIAVR